MAARRRPLPLWLKVLVVVCAAMLPGVSCTCANQEYSRAHKRAIERGLEDYVHQGEVEVIRADIDAYLADAGYVSERNSPFGVETQWRAVTPETRERIDATIQPASGGFNVTLTTERQSLSPQRWELADTTRRGDIELELIAAIAPDQAKQLSAATASGHRYSQSPKIVWAAFETVAQEHQFSMVEFDAPLDSSATSMWVEVDDAKQRSRLEVRFEQQGSSKDQLSVEINERHERAVGERVWTDADDEHDLDLELGLIRHRDPARAANIEAAAERAGKDAYDDAIERGAPAGCACVPY